jgi:DNA topoisomerase-1
MPALPAQAAQALQVGAADAVASARAVGLRYVDCGQAGLRRRPTGKKLRVGKRWVPAFIVEDAAGRRVSDRETLERIRKLAIPPAWDDVWICPSAEGHVQATGRDARGRKQYRYHPRWRAQRDDTKYARMIALGRALPALRRRIAADMARPGLPREKVLATVARLLETTFIRVGNEEYARTNRSFGLTTLEDRHVDIRPSAVRFHFRGKSGVYHEVAVHDPKIARVVRRCRDLPGQELFQYLDEAGQPATIDSADVNAYIHEAAGEAFTAKDFRTWAGSVLAVEALHQEWTSGGGRGERPTNAHVVRAVKRVARQLGNTPAVCRKSYVHPEVIGGFLDGALDGRSPPRAARTAARQAARGRAGNGLTPIESKLLALLRRREAEAKRGTRLARQLRGSLRLVR